MIYFVFFTTAIVAFALYNLFNECLDSKIDKNSIVLKEIKILNSKYEPLFYWFEGKITYTKQQSSKSAFDRMNYEDTLFDYVKSDPKYFKEMILYSQINSEIYSEYKDKYLKIYNEKHLTHKNKYINKALQNKEYKMFFGKILTPSCSFSIEVENMYTSPQGRNSYYDSIIFDEKEILEAIKKINQQSEYEHMKNFERSKMSDSLRYNILRRDGFKCTICGATAQDGAKLHVDHIIPISKGGKTTINNLRTLCSRCNLGKSDKYDPNGIN